MALKRNERYPGRFDNPSAAHPQGAFKNRTSPTAQDGSYFEADWANDFAGFFERLLTVAGVTANGNVDTAAASQYFDALIASVKTNLGSAAQRNAGNGITDVPDMSFFGSNIGNNGYQKFPGGLIMQWGRGALPEPGNKSPVTYSVAFPSAVYSVIATIDAEGTSTVAQSSVTQVTTSGFNFTRFGGGTDYTVYGAFYWIAMGR